MSLGSQDIVRWQVSTVRLRLQHFDCTECVNVWQVTDPKVAAAAEERIKTEFRPR
jgi:hypothetical protein